jgi:hypothetical protein
MKVSSVEMNQIELIKILNDVINQKDFPRHGILAAFIFPQRPLARRNKPRICNRIAAGKQSHVVSGANQFLSEVRYDPFRSSIMFRRYAFDEWRNLSNSHIPFVPREFRLRRNTVHGRLTFRGVMAVPIPTNLSVVAHNSHAIDALVLCIRYKVTSS